MPARTLNMDHLHSLEADNLPLGNGSVFAKVDSLIYKHAKEKFVSDLDGTTFWEPLLVISVLPIAYLLYNLFYHYSIVRPFAKRRSHLKSIPVEETYKLFSPDYTDSAPDSPIKDYAQSFQIQKSVPIRFALEFIVIMVPTLLCICLSSFGSDFIIWIIALMIIAMVMVHNRSRLECIPVISFRGIPFGYNDKRRNYVTMTRTALMIFTLIAILGVDFVIFPRRFAKCETFGFSLMDIGVGAFVLTLGLVSPHIVSKEKKSQRKVSFMATFRSVAPMFLLGVCRWLTTLNLDYQTHISEYGKHWNFWITMAVITFIAYIIAQLSHRYLLISIVISVAYQFVLISPSMNMSSFVTLSDYIMESTDRSTIFSANREGIFSSIGFLCCYLNGTFIGSALLPQRRFKTDVMIVILYLFFGGVIGNGCLTWFAHYYIQNVSRRLANFGYICYVNMCCCWILTLSLIPSVICSYRPQSIIINALDQNLLFVFLVGNLMTGAVNLLFTTLLATPFVAFVIVGSYLFILCALFVFFQQRSIKLKFW